MRVNLAENNFSGPISPSFSNLTRLGTLYLQSNQFSGPLPNLNIPTLDQFDVSNNNLTGQIPNGLSGKPKSAFLGNSLCGDPVNSCNNLKPKKKLSGGAIAGIIIGSVIAFFVILLLVFCLCRILARKSVRSKDEAVANVKEVEIPPEKTAESGGGKDGGSSLFAAAIGGAKEKEIGEGDLNGGGKKGLVFFGKTGWNIELEDLLRASAEVLGKGTFGTAYKAVLETGLAVAVKRLRDVTMPEKEFRKKMEEIGSVDHQHLVPLRAYYYNGEEKLLVYEYLPMGSLSALLHGTLVSCRVHLLMKLFVMNV